MYFHSESPVEKPNFDDELLTARRALRTANWASVFFLITTDILGPYNAPFAFSQVGYVPGTILYVVSEYSCPICRRSIKFLTKITTVGVVACYTGLILWKLFCWLDSDRYPIKTYSDLAERICGKWFRHLCTILQSLQLIFNVRAAHGPHPYCSCRLPDLLDV